MKIKVKEQAELPWLLRGYPQTMENRPFCWIRTQPPGGPLGIPPATWARVLAVNKRMRWEAEHDISSLDSSILDMIG